MTYPPNYPIIGIIGRHRTPKGLFSVHAGKDTVCGFLENELGKENFGVHRIAFADALKDEVCAAFGIDRDYLEAHKAIFRGLLQHWGTDVRRGLWSDDYWLQQWCNRANEVYQSYQLFFKDSVLRPMLVITDVRFQNEIDFIRANHGQLVCVYRLSDEEIDAPAHSSEQLDFKGDIPTIHNVGDLNDLWYETKKYVKDFLPGKFHYPRTDRPFVSGPDIPDYPCDESQR